MLTFTRGERKTRVVAAQDSRSRAAQVNRMLPVFVHALLFNSRDDFCSSGGYYMRGKTLFKGLVLC